MHLLFRRRWSHALAPGLLSCLVFALGCAESPSVSDGESTGRLSQELGAAAPYQVKDLNPIPGDSNSATGASTEGFVVIGTTAFFTAEHPATGIELWKTDGTAAGTVLVMDINPGPDPRLDGLPAPRYLTALNGILYFTADDGVHGVELWRSDGTRAGTWMVKDIRPGASSSNVQALVVMSGKLYFRADDGISGAELWTSDGTEAGTVRLSDIRPGATGGSIDELVVVGNQLFFEANDGSSGAELYVSDGTPAGTRRVKDIHPTGNSSPDNLTPFGSQLFFNATDGINGRELWVSDGTEAGTNMVVDLRPGSNSSSGDPEDMFVWNGLLFFSANTPAGGSDREPYVSDGTVQGTVLLRDIRSGTPGSSPEKFFAFDGRVYFTALTAGTSDRELWVTDGTPAGTDLVLDINPGSSGGNPGNFTIFGGQLFFTATDGSGTELWVTDGTTAGTRLFMDLNPNGSASPFQLFVFDGALYFRANDGTNGIELWKSDGTPAGTQLFVDINPVGKSDSLVDRAEQLTALGSKVIFRGTDTEGGTELWLSDGTIAGTFRLADLKPGSGSSSPNEFTVLPNGRAVFKAEDSAGVEPWVTDGTAAGTFQLMDIWPGPNPSTPGEFAVLNGKVLFKASNGTTAPATSIELYVTDGTTAGTSLLKDIATGTDTSNPANLTPFKGKVYFAASTSVGRELHVTDGTTAGTVLFLDIRTGSAGSSPSNLKVSGDQLFFTANDGTHGIELWVTDGTTGGTRMVLDIAPGTANGSVSNLTDANGKLFFSANDGTGESLWTSDGTASGTLSLGTVRPTGPMLEVNGKLFFSGYEPTTGAELWMSDGSPSGTVLVKDIYPGPTNSTPKSFWTHGGKLYFSADSPGIGAELWESDGTANGTSLVADLNPGILPSDPGVGVRAGDVIYFAANAGPQGRELFAIQLVNPPDLLAPTLACPADEVVTTLVLAGDEVNYSAATATDDVTAQPTIAYTKASGTTFDLGTTTVTVIATDTWGNASTCSFDVTLNYDDVIPPVIACPLDLTASTTDANGTTVTFPAPSAIDEYTATPTVTTDVASGSLFPIGSTTVTATATDDANNTATCTFTVTVNYVDDVPPVITCPPNQTAMTEDPAGVAVTYPAATATDNVGGSPAITYSHASGSTFPIGTTTVTATATDATNNASTCTFDVVVTHVDLTAPVLTCPADVNVGTTGFPTHEVTYAPATAVDSLDADPTITYSHPSGSVFPLGTTTVTVTATDDANNTSTCAFEVTLHDDTAPVITCPETVNATTSAFPDRKVTFPAATATDNVTASPTITYSVASGADFAVGETTVNATATDEANNTASCEFTVILADDVAPELNCPADVTARTSTDDGVQVSYAPATATDDVTELPTLSYSTPTGSLFPIGDTTVTVTGADTAGNEATCSFTVRVTKRVGYTVIEPDEPTGGGCGCSETGNNSSIALGGLLGLVLLARRRRSVI